jgi:hypothetical protein
MTDADDPIPVWAISLRDAFDVVFRNLVPDWQLLERDATDRANEEACRNYDKALRHANEWLREKISQGILIAKIRDPDTREIDQLDRHGWLPLGQFETGIASNFVGPRGQWSRPSTEIPYTEFDPFQSGPNTIIKGARRPVFFDRKSFDNVEIAQPTTVLGKPAVIDKGGRPPHYDWDAIKAFTLEQIAAHGKPHRNNKRLPNKTQLIELIQDEWASRFDQHPSISSVRRHLNRWLAEIDQN